MAPLGGLCQAPCGVAGLSATSALAAAPRLALSGRRTAHRAIGRRCVTRAILDPQQDPILKQALKEPVAFMGGLVAGLLRLDLQEEPLKDWIQRTSSTASGGASPAAGSVDGEIKIDIEETVVASDDSIPTEIVIE